MSTHLVCDGIRHEIVTVLETPRYAINAGANPRPLLMVRRPLGTVIYIARQTGPGAVRDHCPCPVSTPAQRRDTQ